MIHHDYAFYSFTYDSAGLNRSTCRSCRNLIMITRSSGYRSIEKISSHLWRMKFPLMTIARLCEKSQRGQAIWKYKLRHLSLGPISVSIRYIIQSGGGLQFSGSESLEVSLI